MCNLPYPMLLNSLCNTLEQGETAYVQLSMYAIYLE